MIAVADRARRLRAAGTTAGRVAGSAIPKAILKRRVVVAATVNQ
jgi:hypothetical protein